jgi:hypothetical protein
VAEKTAERMAHVLYYGDALRYTSEAGGKVCMNTVGYVQAIFPAPNTGAAQRVWSGVDNKSRSEFQRR